MLNITLDKIFQHCEQEGDCQVWRLSVSNGGRPVWHHRPSGSVRRMVWELEHGKPMRAKHYACSTCDTPLCVSHVKSLNRSQQMLLASSRGRTGGPNHSAKLAQLKRSQSTKLDAGKVELMKKRRAEGATYAQLGVEFGVHLSFAHRICKGGAWSPIVGSSVFAFRP